MVAALHRLSIAAAAFSALLLTPSMASAQWFQWTGPSGNGHWYRLTTTAGNWTQARDEASALGGHLVSVGSQEENSFLQATFFPVQREAFWIGLVRSGGLSTGTFNFNEFVWDSGEALTFANWNEGEPNNCACGYLRADQGERFGVINWHYYIEPNYQTFWPWFEGAQGTWNDVPHDGFDNSMGSLNPLAYYGIVESAVAPVVTPEPSTAVLTVTGAALLALVGQQRRRRQSA
jgi:hypothetical protein